MFEFTDEVKDHVRKQIRNMYIDQTPWEHAVVTNLFPHDLYQYMLSNFPFVYHMEKLSRHSSNRYIYWLEKYGKSVDELSEFWYLFKYHMWPVFVEELSSKFNIAPDYTGGELVYDVPGYELGPHTDAPDRLLTGVMYLPPKTGFELYGTCLIKGDKPDPAGRGHRWSEGDFQTFKTVPYSPNSGLFFKRTNWSYHAVMKTPIERYSLSFDMFKESSK